MLAQQRRPDRRWSPEGPPGASALVVIPETISFFNNIAGRRLAEALANLGWGARVVSLREYDGEAADVAFLVGLHELIVSCGDDAEGLARVDRLRAACGLTAMWLLEPTGTSWFEISHERFLECRIDLLLDNALHDQAPTLAPGHRPAYRFVFYGLTEREKRQVRAARFEDDRRSIPWAFVGLQTPARCELARFLVDEVDPSGFLYLTDVLPHSEDGPGLKDETLQRVLGRTRYQLWRSQGSYFYMEGERYRRSALAGCVPLKILVEDTPGGRELPFANLLVARDDLAGALDPATFPAIRDAFVAEYLGLPSLEDELRRVLRSIDLPVPAGSEACS